MIPLLRTEHFEQGVRAVGVSPYFSAQEAKAQGERKAMTTKLLPLMLYQGPAEPSATREAGNFVQLTSFREQQQQIPQRRIMRLTSSPTIIQQLQQGQQRVERVASRTPAAQYQQGQRQLAGINQQQKQQGFWQGARLSMLNQQLQKSDRVNQQSSQQRQQRALMPATRIPMLSVQIQDRQRQSQRTFPPTQEQFVQQQGGGLERRGRRATERLATINPLNSGGARFYSTHSLEGDQSRQQGGQSLVVQTAYHIPNQSTQQGQREVIETIPISTDFQQRVQRRVKRSTTKSSTSSIQKARTITQVLGWPAYRVLGWALARLSNYSKHAKLMQQMRRQMMASFISKFHQMKVSALNLWKKNSKAKRIQASDLYCLFTTLAGVRSKALRNGFSMLTAQSQIQYAKYIKRTADQVVLKRLKWKSGGNANAKNLQRTLCHFYNSTILRAFSNIKNTVRIYEQEQEWDEQVLQKAFQPINKLIKTKSLSKGMLSLKQYKQPVTYVYQSRKYQTPIQQKHVQTIDLSPQKQRQIKVLESPVRQSPPRQKVKLPTPVRKQPTPTKVSPPKLSSRKASPIKTTPSLIRRQLIPAQAMQVLRMQPDIRMNMQMPPSFRHNRMSLPLAQRQMKHRSLSPGAMFSFQMGPAPLLLPKKMSILQLGYGSGMPFSGPAMNQRRSLSPGLNRSLSFDGQRPILNGHHHQSFIPIKKMSFGQFPNPQAGPRVNQIQLGYQQMHRHNSERNSPLRQVGDSRRDAFSRKVGQAQFTTESYSRAIATPHTLAGHNQIGGNARYQYGYQSVSGSALLSKVTASESYSQLHHLHHLHPVSTSRNSQGMLSAGMAQLQGMHLNQSQSRITPIRSKCGFQTNDTPARMQVGKISQNGLQSADRPNQYSLYQTGASGYVSLRSSESNLLKSSLHAGTSSQLQYSGRSSPIKNIVSRGSITAQRGAKGPSNARLSPGKPEYGLLAKRQARGLSQKRLQ